MRNDMYYSVMTQANSEKEIPSAPIRSRTYDLPITGLKVLPITSSPDSSTRNFFF